MKKFFMVLVCALLAVAAAAQSATMMAMARAELEKRGLSEVEVRARLLQNGIDVDSIPPSEYASYQSRVISILNQMQAEKEKEKAGQVAAANAGGENAVTAASSANDVDASTEIPLTTVGEAAAEKVLEQTLTENNVDTHAGDNIYGHDLFSSKALDVFRTTDGAQAPESYVLGEGDEVHISIFGSSQTEIHQRIGPDGSIQPAGAAKIFLKGMTLSQGRTAIQNKLAQHYSFRTDQIAVTISTARTVTLSIYGEVGVQGGFTISALNTAFNALAAAGGPTEIGSVRNIQLARDGKARRLDLYAYIKNPATSSNYDIQNGDVIFVPVSQKIVRIEGAVNRPMRYEMIDGETLIDLITFAGGLKYDAYADFVQIERFENGEKKYLEYDLASVMNKGKKIQIMAGDVVRIKAFNEPLDKFVNIEGSVYYGGNYDLAGNTSLKTLIENAKPRKSARKDFVFVERVKVDETVEVLTVPYPGTDGNPDFILQARDKVRVLEMTDYRDLGTITVSGQVRAPFTKDFGLNDSMTIAQAIEYAGGLKQTVFPVAYIFRKDLSNPDKMEYIRISLEKDGDTLLQPGDELRIYDNTTYTNVGEVRVSGAVKNPFGTPYDPSLTIHDLLEMAGGFNVGAAYDRVEVFRLNISKTERVSFDVIDLSVDENYNLKKGHFQLQPYDHIVVRLTPSFTTGRTVEVNGRVKYPGTYVLEDKRTKLSDVIDMAGGLLNDADPFVTLFRAHNGRGQIGLNLKETMWSDQADISGDPILMEGDVINITRMENLVTIREHATQMSQYIVPGGNPDQTTVVYKGPHNAKWYINKCAGGFAKTADRNSVTVTLPNNQTLGTKHFLFFRIYPKVEPGSIIALTTDPDKERVLLEPKEKVNWDNVYSKVLTSITSITTIILLIDRLK